jgi:hypothetical protein
MYGQQNPYSQYPYTGYTYPNYGQRNYMQPQQQMAQPQMQQQVQGQPQQPIMPTLCYAKMEEAKPYIITAPNSSMLFIDREKGKALLKSTDNMYNTYSQYFNFVETDENGNTLKPQEPTPQVDYSQFVTKKEIDGLPTADQYKQLAEQYNTLLAKFETMQKLIAGGKPNGNGTNTAKGN